MSRLLGLKIEEEFFKLSPKLIKNREKAPFDGWVNGQHIEFKSGRNNTITVSAKEYENYENRIYNPLIIQAYTKLINDQYHITITNNFMATDLLGERYAIENDIKIKKFPALWNKYNKAAGFIRNEEMAEYADASIILWDGISRGTKHMIDLSNKYRLENYILRV